jgi:hypothetical protein
LAVAFEEAFELVKESLPEVMPKMVPNEDNASGRLHSHQQFGGVVTRQKRM